MKIVGIIAALALATAPMLAASQDSDSVPDEQVAAAEPEPGGISQTGSLEVFSLSSIPAGALVVGGVVILAGAIIGVIASEDSTVSTTN